MIITTKMNIHTVLTLFKQLDSDFTIYEEEAEYILKWFNAQNKLPKTLLGLRILVIEIYRNSNEGVSLEDLMTTDSVLTLEYWGGDWYPENADWSNYFQQNRKCPPSIWVLGGSGKEDVVRFAEEKEQFLKLMNQ